MSFILKKGKVKQVWLPVTPSTALDKGTLVEFSSGKLAAADDNEAAADIVGVLNKTIAATDDDYASDRLVPVLIPMERHTEWEADTADTYVQASHCGVEVGIANSSTVDLDDTTNDAFKVIGGSGTKVRGFIKFNGAY